MLDPAVPFDPSGSGGVLVAAIALLCATAGWGLTGLVLALLRRKAIFDHPNERSSHTVPTPRGGGWGIVATVLPVWVLISQEDGSLAQQVPFFIAIALVIAISWIDDVRGASAGTRFAVQSIAVAVGLSTLPPDSLVFQDQLPFWLDRTVSALGWLWFINLFNFMDGIDGIAGTEAVTISGGLIVIAALGGYAASLAWQAAAIAGAAVGFLIWNWQPARVFMGEIGSVPLGLLLGWLLIQTALEGGLTAAVLLPLYFLADASVTLIRRLWQGKKFWHAHKEHYYQKGVQNGRSHAAVVIRMTAINMILIGSAVLALTDSNGAGTVLAVLFGGGSVGGLMIHLSRPRQRSS